MPGSGSADASAVVHNGQVNGHVRCVEDHPSPAQRVRAALTSSLDASADGSLDGPVDFDIVVQSRGVVAVMTVFGEIDLATAPSLYETLRQLREHDRRHVLIDLASVTFMDGSVLAFLLTARRELAAAGGSASVVDGNRLLARLLDVTGLRNVLMGDEPESARASAIEG